MVPEEGLEPSRIAPRDFESRAYTNSATPAYEVYYLNFSQNAIPAPPSPLTPLQQSWRGEE